MSTHTIGATGAESGAWTLQELIDARERLGRELEPWPGMARRLAPTYPHTVARLQRHAPTRHQLHQVTDAQ